MPIVKTPLFPAIFVLLGACGGVSDSTLVADLDDDALEVLCEDLVVDYAPRTFTCDPDGDAIEVEVGFSSSTVGECVSEFAVPPEGCPATVGDLRACYDALFLVSEEDVCGGAQPGAPQDPQGEPACDTLLSAACL